MKEAARHNDDSLTQKAGLPDNLELQARRADDHAWIEVIRKMDSIYADLVHYQVELEEKNSALENAERFIQSVISSMTDILIVCNVDGSIQQVNQALVEIIDRRQEDLVGTPLRRLFASRYQPMVADFLEHIRSESVMDCEVELVDSGGQSVPMAVNCNARFDHKNRLSGLVITGRPLGELRRTYSELQKAHEELKTAQMQLIQSEKMASLGRLVAGVAHELNNPISFLFANMHALKAYQQKFSAYVNAVHTEVSKSKLDRLRRELNIDKMMDDIEPLVDGSLEGAERVSEIVQNLRRFTTPQEKKKEDFDLVPVVERAVSWVRKAASGEPAFELEMPQKLVIHSNEGYVHQILINLIQNAVDVVEQIERPLIRVGVEADDGQVEIVVRDNGPGIAEEDLVKIFDPFFTTKAVGSGTGLGLYISYGLATEQLQGDLVAANHADGGAEFRLRLRREASA